MKKAFNIVSDSTIQKELTLEEKINYIQNIADNYQNEKSLYKAMAKNLMKLIFTKGFGGKSLNKDTIEEINKCYSALKNVAIRNAHNFLIQKESKTEFCFQNGNVVLPLEIAMRAGYTFDQIATILHISCEEVNKQFNDMIKDMNYTF